MKGIRIALRAISHATRTIDPAAQRIYREFWGRLYDSGWTLVGTGFVAIGLLAVRRRYIDGPKAFDQLPLSGIIARVSIGWLDAP